MEFSKLKRKPLMVTFITKLSFKKEEGNSQMTGDKLAKSTKLLLLLLSLSLLLA